MVSQIPRRLTGSRPVVGSSRITTEGLAIIAQPVAAVASANTNEQSQVIVNLRQKLKKNFRQPLHLPNPQLITAS